MDLIFYVYKSGLKEQTFGHACLTPVDLGYWDPRQL